MDQSIITASLGSINDKTQDAARVFYNNQKASTFYGTCAKQVGNVGELKFLASYKGDVPITSYSYSKGASTYVTTTESHYADYAWDEVVFHIGNPLVRVLCRVLIFFIRVVCWISDVNNEDVCFFNNSLISTNLYRDEVDVAKNYSNICHELADAHRKHICVFRCLDRVGTPELLKILAQDGDAVLIVSRVVNQLDTSDDGIWQRSNCKKDSITLERHIGAKRDQMREIQAGNLTIGEVIDLCAKESLTSSHVLRTLGGNEPPQVYERMCEVYSQLYLEKYSRHNPEYTARFFQEVTKVWSIVILERRHDNFIEGFMCLSDPGGSFVSCPALGYDLTSPTPSYLILQYWAILEAKSRKKKLNMSGGVSAYKQMRGAVPVLEFSGVTLPKSLGFRRRLFWKMMGFVTKYLVRPLVGRKKIT